MSLRNIQEIFPILSNISLFSVFLFLISICIFVFSKHIIAFLDTSELEKKHLGEKDLQEISKKQSILRFITSFIICIYLVTFYIQTEFLNNAIKIIFIILVLYIVNSWVKKKILLFYGDEIEISGEHYIRRGYKTQIFGFITTIVLLIIFVYGVFQVFGIDSFLEGGGIIAGILALIGFTAPVWGADVVASIMILHNGEVEAGQVIRIGNKGILAWVKNINLSEVKLIDLAYGHPIIMRPSLFRNERIENISNGVVGKRNMLLATIDIKISYTVSKEDIQKLTSMAFDDMIDNAGVESRKRHYFPKDIQHFLEISDFGDDAVHYKFGYYITSPFYLLKAERLLNEYLFKHQKAMNIYFSTPKLLSFPLNQPEVK